MKFTDYSSYGIYDFKFKDRGPYLTANDAAAAAGHTQLFTRHFSETYCPPRRRISFAVD